MESRVLLSAGDLVGTVFPFSQNGQPNTSEGASVAASEQYFVSGKPSANVGGFYGTGAVEIYHAVNGNHLFTLNNPTPADSDQFGASVAVSGNRVVVGAFSDDTGASSAGSVYVFDLTGGVAALAATINNPFPDNSDHFGLSVGISGDKVVVGASGDNSGANYSGSAYVFDLSSGLPVLAASIGNPTPASGDGFGSTVAIDGNTVVIGASNDDTGATNAGSVYVYDVSSGSATLTATVNNPTPVSGDSFGNAIAVSGNRMVIGAPNDDTGASNAGSAYLYTLAGGTATLAATINNPSPAVGDSFGHAVSIDGSRLIVGAFADDAGASNAGSAYVYNIAGNSVQLLVTINNPGPATNDFFGSSVAIQNQTVLVGSRNDTTNAAGAGGSYLYDVSSGAAVLTASLNTPSPPIQEYFGFSVAVSGSRLLVGAPQDNTGAQYSGSAYLFDLTSGSPLLADTIHNPIPSAGDYFGNSISVDSDFVVIGAPYANGGAGSAYIYDVSSGSTVLAATLDNPSPATNDIFGWSVAVSGNTIAVGAYADDTGATDSGSVYIYSLASGSAVLTATVQNPSPANSDLFGYSVALSGDTLVVGAFGDDTGASDSGSAYLYDLSSGSAVLTANLTNPTPAASDQFGWSVAVSGEIIVVGARADDTGASNAGSAYVYDLSSGSAVLSNTINNPTPESGDEFGVSVAIDGQSVVIGASNESTGAYRAGSSYVYDLASGTATLAASINNPTPQSQDSFGSAVAVSGETIVVGAFQDNTQNVDQGAAYIFSGISRNQSPTAFDDAFDAIWNTPTILDVLADNGSGADFDPDGDELSIDSVTQPLHGTVSINIDGTLTYEPAYDYFGSDQFTYTISDGFGGADTATVTVGVIEVPKLVIRDVTMLEGNGSFGAMSFRVDITGVPDQTVTVDYQTVDGTATASDNDYISAAGTLSWIPGDLRSKSITFKVLGDRKIEPTEYLKMRLTNPVNAILETDVGYGYILNDEYDFGDAPLTYGTSITRHGTIPGFHLGETIDAENSAQLSLHADGDGTDEDGVSLAPTQIIGRLNSVEINVTNSSGVESPFVDAWFDWNQDGDFQDAGEHSISAIVGNGVNSLVFDVPSDAIPGQTYGRFRLSAASDATGLSDGLIASGEVEDYLIYVSEDSPVAAVNFDLGTNLGTVPDWTSRFFGDANDLFVEVGLGQPLANAVTFFHGSLAENELSQIAASTSGRAEIIGFFNGLVILNARQPNGSTQISTMPGSGGLITPLGSVESRDPGWIMPHPSGDFFLFAGRDGFGTELWRSDGTSNGTIRIADLAPGSGNGVTFNNPKYLGNDLYFSGPGGSLWKSDGSSGGTVQVTSAVSSIKDMVVFGGQVYFTGTGLNSDGVRVDGLWRSDGTSSGTELVAPSPRQTVSFNIVTDGTRLHWITGDYLRIFHVLTLNETGNGAEPVYEFDLSNSNRRFELASLTPVNDGVVFWLYEYGTSSTYRGGATLFFAGPDGVVQLHQTGSTRLGPLVVSQGNVSWMSYEDDFESSPVIWTADLQGLNEPVRAVVPDRGPLVALANNPQQTAELNRGLTTGYIDDSNRLLFGMRHSTTSASVWGVVEMPQASAGPDQTVDEGDVVQLQGFGTFDSLSGAADVEWDLDFDGVFFQADATGLAPSFAAIDGPGSRTVALRVTDRWGNVSIDTATVTVTNVAPAVSGISDTSSVFGVPLNLSANVTDPGASDALAIQWDLGDGTLIDDLLTLSHTYAAEGEYFASLTVTDSDGAVTVKDFRVVVGPPVAVTASATDLQEGQAVTLTASLVTALSQDVIVPLTYSGTAISGVDFAATAFGGAVPLQIVIPAGATSGSVQIFNAQDALDENVESLIINIGVPSNASLVSHDPFHVDLQDDDAEPTVFISSTPQVIAEADVVLPLTISLSEVSGRDVIVSLSTSGTALVDTDYRLGDTVLVIPAGETSVSTTLTIIDDILGEGAEQLSVSIDVAQNAVLSSLASTPNKLTHVVSANDAPTVQFATALKRVPETAGAHAIVVTLSNESDSPITIDYSLSGSAIIGQDYVGAASGTLTFPAFTTSRSIALSLINDNSRENTKAIVATIQNPVGAILGSTSLHATQIIDDESLTVTFVTSARSLWEDEGYFTVTARLNSAAPSGGFSIPISFGGTALEGTHYFAESNAFAFSGGETSKTLTFLLASDDSVYEPNQTINITAEKPAEATLANDKVSVSILDNEVYVSLVRVNGNRLVGAKGTTVDEGDSTATFTAYLDRPTNKDVTINFKTQGITAERSDYSPQTSSLTIPAGSVKASGTVGITNDGILEDTETVRVSITSATNALLHPQSAARQFEVAIRDNDSPPIPYWEFPGGVIREADTPIVILKVSLARAAETTFYADFTVSGSATQNEDYVINGLSTAQGRVTFDPGEQEKYLTIAIVDDGHHEDVETIDLHLDTGGARSASYTIPLNDNDAESREEPKRQWWEKWGDEISNAAQSVGEAVTGAVEYLKDFAGDVSIILANVANGAQNSIDYSNFLNWRHLLSSQLFDGYLDDATVFVDFNFNESLDFIDVNSDGVANQDELVEIAVQTDYDGQFRISIPFAADRNLDGLISLDEGQLVAFGGTDVSLGAESSVPMTAPLTYPTVSPLTTLVAKLRLATGDAIGDVEARVATGLSLTSPGYLRADLIFLANQGDAAAADTFATSVQVYSTVQQIASFASGVDSGPSMRLAGSVAFADIASKLSSESALLDFTEPVVVKSILLGTLNRLGIHGVANDLLDAATEIIIAGNQSMAAAAGNTGRERLEAIVRAQSVSMGAASDAMTSLANGTSSAAEVVPEFIGANREAQIQSAVIGNVVAPFLVADDVQIVEGDDGTKLAVFNVGITSPSNLPVTVDFATSDVTAFAGEDYQSVAGQLTWEPGGTTVHQIQVPIFGDTLSEADERFHLLLTNAVNAAVFETVSYGDIISDDAAGFVASDNSVDHDLVLDADSTRIRLFDNGSVAFEGAFEGGQEFVVNSVDGVRNDLTVVMQPDSATPAEGIRFIGNGANNSLTIDASYATSIDHVQYSDGNGRFVIDGATLHYENVGAIISRASALLTGIPVNDIRYGETVSLTATPSSLFDATELTTESWVVYRDDIAIATNSGSELQFTVDDVGMYRLTYTATQEGRLLAIASYEFAVIAVPPSAAIVSADIGDEGAEIQFDANASDPDGSIEDLTYVWTFGDGVAVGDSTLLNDARFDGPVTAGYSIGSDRDIAQAFTVQNDGTLTSIDLQFSFNPGTTGSLLVQIVAVNQSGFPDLSQVLGSKSVDIAQLNRNIWSSIDGFSVDVQQGNVLAVLVRKEQPSTSIAIRGADGNVYSSGQGFSKRDVDPDWAAISTDIVFQTLVISPPSVELSGKEVSHTYADNGEYEVTLIVTDKDGLSTTVTKTIRIDNVAPTAVISDISAVQVEGTPIEVVASATDPAGVNDTLTFVYQVFKGDSLFASGGGVGEQNFSFTPDDNGSYEVKLTVFDEDGGQSGALQELTLATAELGTTGGPVPGVSLNGVQLVGAKFEVTATMDVTEIGGHILTYSGTGPFAALVRLTGPNDFPDSFDLSTPDVIAATVLQNSIGASADVSSAIDATLTPGWYAVVMGSELFGATGNSVAAKNNSTTGSPSFFSKVNAQPYLSDTSITGVRFFITGTVTSDRAGQSIEVENANPEAFPDYTIVSENAPETIIDVISNDTDPAGLNDPLSVLSVDSAGTVGVVRIESGHVLYSTNQQFEHLAAGESTTDTFVYSVEDGDGGSDFATVTITISGKNDLPVAEDIEATVFESDGDVLIVARYTDVDTRDTHRITLDDSLLSGSIVDNEDGTFTYRTNGVFESLDNGETAFESFSYTVNDGNGGSSTATVSISIVGQNDAPVANDDFYLVSEESLLAPDPSVGIFANDTDAEASALTLFQINGQAIDSIITLASGATVTATLNGNWVYDPRVAFNYLDFGETGTDSFTYKISDDGGLTSMATVNLTINGWNDAASIAGIDAVTVSEDTDAVSGNLVVTDPDSGQSFFVARHGIAGAYGRFSIDANGNWIYDVDNPLANLLGEGESAVDSFIVASVDGTSSRTVTITIQGGDDNDSDGIDDDVELAAGDGNKDGIDDNLQDNVASLLNAVNQTYVTVAADATAQLIDVLATTLITANVAPPEDVEFPIGFIQFGVTVATPGDWAEVTLYFDEAQPFNAFYKFGSTDENSQPHYYEFTYDSVSETGAIIYADRVVLRLKDGGRGDADGLANGIVRDPFALALAQRLGDDFVATDEDASLTFDPLRNDVSTGELTVVAVSDPMNGTVEIEAGGRLTYVPAADFNGVDTFNYVVVDALGNERQATVFVTVIEVNDAPIVVTPIGNVGVSQGANDVVLDISSTFSDIDGPFSLTATSSDVSLVVPSIVGTSLTLNFPPSISGTAVITVVADDGSGGVTSVSFEVAVSNVVPDLADIIASADSIDDASVDGTVTVKGRLVDLGLDTHLVTVNWGDGTVENVSVDQLADTFSGSHEYASGGLYSVVVRTTDSNGATSGEYVFDAFVEGVGVIDGTLYIIGTNGRDDVKLKIDEKKDQLKIDAKLGRRGGPDGGSDGNSDGGSDGGGDRIRFTTTASDIDRVVAFLRDGDDRYDGGGGGSDGRSDGGRDRSINIRQLIFGGHGDDILSGGGWMDAIFGGAGKDKIDGDGGADILVGDDGRDSINGEKDEDLLIGDIVDNNFNDSSILDDVDAAMVEWAAGDLADTMVYLGPVLDDGDRDKLVGRKREDRMFGGTDD